MNVRKGRKKAKESVKFPVFNASETSLSMWHKIYDITDDNG